MKIRKKRWARFEIPVFSLLKFDENLSFNRSPWFWIEFAKFFKFASLLVVFIALTSINGALVLSGSKYSFDHWVWAFKTTFLSTASASAPTNDVTINVFNNGYSPHNFSVKVNQPVNLSLVTQGTYSCASVFTIPFLNITKVLPPTGTTNVTFTPTRTGLISFACGMGMYTGTINVVP